jgi:ribosomal protein L7/L12
MAAETRSPGASESSAADPKTFEVVLYSVGDRRNEVVEVVDAVTGFGPAVAGRLVELVDPFPAVKSGVAREEAQRIVECLEEAGAQAYVEDSRDTYAISLVCIREGAERELVVRRLGEIGLGRAAARRAIARALKDELGADQPLVAGLPRAHAERLVSRLAASGMQTWIHADAATRDRWSRDEWDTFERRFGHVDYDPKRIDDAIGRLEGAFLREFGPNGETMCDRSADVWGETYLLHWEHGHLVLCVYNPRFDDESENEEGYGKAGETQFDGVIRLVDAPYQVKVVALGVPLLALASTLDDL